MKILGNASDQKMMSFESGTYWLGERLSGNMAYCTSQREERCSSTHIKGSSQFDLPCRREREGIITYECTSYSSNLEALNASCNVQVIFFVFVVVDFTLNSALRLQCSPVQVIWDGQTTNLWGITFLCWTDARYVCIHQFFLHLCIV